MKHVLVLSLIFLLSFSLSGQDSTIATVTLSGQKVSFGQAARYRIVWKEDTVWRVDDYYLNEVLASQKSFSDEDFTEMTGTYVSFFPNGSKRFEGTVVGKRFVGEYKEWHNNGAISAEGIYRNMSKKEGRQFENSNELIPVPIEDFVFLGTKRGTWKYYHSNGEVSAIIEYSEGEINRAEYFDPAGNLEESDKVTDRPAHYEGGYEALYKMLTAGFRPPNRKKKKNFGLVKVKFTVERNGSISHVNLHTSVNEGLDRMCLSAVKTMPDFVPAIEHNRLVSTDHILPFQFNKK